MLDALAAADGAAATTVRCDARDRTRHGIGDAVTELFLRPRDLSADRKRTSRAKQPCDTTIVHDCSTFPPARWTANRFQRLAEPSASDLHPDGNALGSLVSHWSRTTGESPSIVGRPTARLTRRLTGSSPTRCDCH